ncbi:hypothetical protein [Actinokineospora sp. NBRC 105648]|uniref:hypothetical protein n=1 Tax=Actinokineospora sp. NBRC 105648 TaxID=3032206 RepID=UPI0024A466E9|nr:hypothetical protein [Actinokineospora sp. NBRC 105648]GLZ39305.1 hypothetical protein Acsp05_29290 [Actinokineospora sp. NBRC 105648]
MADEQSPDGRRGTRPAARRVVVTALVGLVLLGAVATVITWRATGGRWLSVDTPSMGEAAPVGTLVLTRPTSLAELQVGDIISFKPPGGGPIHTHRLVAVDGSTLRTKGDINGAEDGVPLREEDVLGKVVARWWGLAWLVKALPILAFGGLAVWLLTRWTGPRWRTPLRLVGYPLVVCVAVVVLRPLVGATLLSTFAAVNETRATVVSTGILPIRVSTPDGRYADLRAGQVSDLVSTATDDRGHLPITIDAHMPLSWWVVCLLLCAVPLVLSLFVRPKVVP